MKPKQRHQVFINIFYLCAFETWKQRHQVFINIFYLCAFETWLKIIKERKTYAY